MKKEPTAKALQKYEMMLVYERQAWAEGYLAIAGIDEAGRGPLAGPVVAAACILDPARPVYGVDDSKKLTPASRERLFDVICSQAIAWSVGICEPAIIDRINILQATCTAMREAARGISTRPDILLIDAVKLQGMDLPVWPIVRGDALSASIAAASIVAKITRDRLMDEYDARYPGYGFGQHKGYGTPAHYEALLRYGPCPIHRQTFLRTLGDKSSRDRRGESLQDG